MTDEFERAAGDARDAIQNIAARRRCGSCKHWVFDCGASPERRGECHALHGNANSQVWVETEGPWILLMREDFGCVLWEAE